MSLAKSSSLSLGPLMVGVNGLSLTLEERELLSHPLIGGVILFTRNYAAPEQVSALTQEIHAVRTQPLLIAVDQEGGRVQRFRAGLTQLPALGKIGQYYAQQPELACELAQAAGWLMASEMLALGIDISFAPVLDLDLGISEVIGNRSFHAAPEAVVNLAQAYIQGLHTAGMPAIAKHFPGHGSVAADSHVAMPVDERDYAEIAAQDLQPFTQLMAAGQLDGIMPAHVIYAAVDDKPAGFSTYWLQTILRQKLGFNGVIFSDDLGMQAAHVVGDHVARAQHALQAGCDMLLLCNESQAVHDVLAGLNQYHNVSSQERLIQLSRAHVDGLTALHTSDAWQTATALLATHKLVNDVIT